MADGSGGKQGYILIWVLFYFVIIDILVLSLMNNSILEALISINHRHAIQAFAMADGGALVGVEQVYTILARDYSNSQDIPEQLELEQQEWQFNESGRSLRFVLENPRCTYQGDGECRFQFNSQGFCPPAHKTVLMEVGVKYTDYYTIPYGGGEAVLVFDHREFIYPARITSLKI